MVADCVVGTSIEKRRFLRCASFEADVEDKVDEDDVDNDVDDDNVTDDVVANDAADDTDDADDDTEDDVGIGILTALVVFTVFVLLAAPVVFAVALMALDADSTVGFLDSLSDFSSANKFDELPP